jgi:hypothetical protein
MSKGSMVVLILALVIMVALFVMLFMGLGGNSVIAPRAPL